MSATEIMERAADVIDEKGWCKRSFQNAQGEVCVLGALKLAAGFVDGKDNILAEFGWITDNNNTSALRNAAAYIELELSMGITRWNDTYCTDQNEATDMLRSVAKRWLNDPVTAEKVIRINLERRINHPESVW
jgi:hypothetical protein